MVSALFIPYILADAFPSVTRHRASLSYAITFLSPHFIKIDGFGSCELNVFVVQTGRLRCIQILMTSRPRQFSLRASFDKSLFNR